MQNQVDLKLLFIINPVSGGKEKHDWEAAIRNYFSNEPHRIEFYLLTGKDDRSSVRHYIQTVMPDRVIAVGGDGTVKMLAGMLKETNIPLGILPAGSANGLARELEIPLNAEDALDVVVNGESRKMDVIKVNEEEICIHLADIGLNAMLVKYFERSPKRGMWGYGKAILRVMWEKQKMRISLEADDVKVQRKAYMVVLANARKYGTGANINPNGDVADGRFEVVVVRKLNLFEILKAIFTEKSFNPDKIEVFSTTSAELRVQRKAYFQVDGEYRGKTTSIKARIMPGVLHMMLPLARNQQ
ncbi:MAG TPA: YegS/Rv2252/BmrU family lipid kinase [Flavisolibacter sp.]|nr:YegS/Rv2252/BmrU family lipid kinase [Flavisolibacter sp.]